MSVLRSVWPCALALLLLGCSDDRTPAPGGDASPDVGQQADAKPNPGCPEHLPVDGSACTQEVTGCSYGDDPACLATASCAQGSWTVSIPACAGSDPACPATWGAASGQDCSAQDATCDFSGLACTCTNCVKYPVAVCQGPLTWHCEAPNPDEGCPHARPEEGTSCTAEGQFCDYGCEPDVSRECAGGVWVAASSPGGCPISTRRAKKEIRYLSETDRARIAEQARGIRLATYRYRDPARDRRSHLGFILEDSPTCAAADTQGMRVDLYAYASMVLALAQQQQQQITDLQRELAAVRGQLKRLRRRVDR